MSLKATHKRSRNMQHIWGGYAQNIVRNIPSD
jgi:hypothetical protein